jgi:hypothetical protein
MSDFRLVEIVCSYITSIGEFDQLDPYVARAGLRGRRRTYHIILKLADHALFKMVRYVLLRPLRPEQNRPARRTGPTDRT